MSGLVFLRFERCRGAIELLQVVQIHHFYLYSAVYTCSDPEEFSIAGWETPTKSDVSNANVTVAGW